MLDPNITRAFIAVACYHFGVDDPIITDGHFEQGWESLLKTLASWISREQRAMSRLAWYREELWKLWRGEHQPVVEDIEIAALVECLRETLWAKP